MDVTSAINSLGTDYVSKVSQAMQDSATGSTAKTDIHSIPFIMQYPDC